MKTTLGHLIVAFFRSHLAAQRNCSPNTISSYSDCIRLLLQYACEHLQVHIDRLGHADIKTTSQYFEINLDMKRQALDRCPAPSLNPGKQKPEWQTPSILQFLAQLSKRSALC